MKKKIVHIAKTRGGELFGVMRRQARKEAPSWLIVQFKAWPPTLENVGLIIAEEATKQAAVGNINRVCSFQLLKGEWTGKGLNGQFWHHLNRAN